MVAKRLIAVLAFVVPSFAFSQLSKDDPTLTKKVSLSLTMTPLKDVVAEFQKVAGAPIHVAPSIADWKAVILVKDRTLFHVMDNLADTFRCEWVKEKDGYRLVQLPARAADERQFVDAEAAMARKWLDRDIAALLKYSKYSYEELSALYGQTTAKAKAEPDSHKKNDLWQVAGSISPLIMDPQAWAQSKVFSQLDKDGWKAFWNGGVLPCSTEPEKGFYRIPSLPLQRRDETLEESTRRLAPTYVFLRLDSNPLQILSKMAKKRDGELLLGGSCITGFVQPQGDVLELPFWREVEAWGEVREEWPALKELIQKRIPALPSKYSSGYYSDADHLSWLHDQTGLDIIAQGFRCPNKWSSLERYSSSVAAYLKVFKESTGGWWSTKDQVIRFRPGYFWQKKQRETPESLLRPMEANEAAGRLSLRDYVSLVSHVDSKQAAALGDPTTCLVTFIQHPIKDALHAFRFCATLSNEQLRAVLEGKSLYFDELSAQAKRSFMQAVMQGMMDGRPMGDLSEILDPNETARGRLAFTIRTKDVRDLGRHKPLPLDRRIGPPRTQEEEDLAREYRGRPWREGEGMEFLFGKSSECRIRYLTSRLK